MPQHSTNHDLLPFSRENQVTLPCPLFPVSPHPLRTPELDMTNVTYRPHHDRHLRSLFLTLLCNFVARNREGNLARATLEGLAEHEELGLVVDGKHTSTSDTTEDVGTGTLEE